MIFQIGVYHCEFCSIFVLKLGRDLLRHHRGGGLRMVLQRSMGRCCRISKFTARMFSTFSLPGKLKRKACWRRSEMMRLLSISTWECRDPFACTSFRGQCQEKLRDYACTMKN